MSKSTPRPISDHGVTVRNGGGHENSNLEAFYTNSATKPNEFQPVVNNGAPAASMEAVAYNFGVALRRLYDGTVSTLSGWVKRIPNPFNIPGADAASTSSETVNKKWALSKEDIDILRSSLKVEFGNEPKNAEEAKKQENLREDLIKMIIANAAHGELDFNLMRYCNSEVTYHLFNQKDYGGANQENSERYDYIKKIRSPAVLFLGNDELAKDKKIFIALGNYSQKLTSHLRKTLSHECIHVSQYHIDPEKKVPVINFSEGEDYENAVNECIVNLTNFGVQSLICSIDGSKEYCKRVKEIIQESFDKITPIFIGNSSGIKGEYYPILKTLASLTITVDRSVGFRGFFVGENSSEYPDFLDFGRYFLVKANGAPVVASSKETITALNVEQTVDYLERNAQRSLEVRNREDEANLLATLPLSSTQEICPKLIRHLVERIKQNEQSSGVKPGRSVRKPISDKVNGNDRGEAEREEL